MTLPALSRPSFTGFAGGRTVIAAVAAAVAVPLLVVLGAGSLGGFTTGYREGITIASFLVAAAFAVARPLLWRRERLPWALLALGIVSYAVAQLVRTFWFGSRAEPPSPGMPDALSLAAYPCWIAAFAILARHRRGAHGIRVWLDAARAARVSHRWSPSWPSRRSTTAAAASTACSWRRTSPGRRPTCCCSLSSSARSLWKAGGSAVGVCCS